MFDNEIISIPIIFGWVDENDIKKGKGGYILA
jgi:hypothetical protein